MSTRILIAALMLTGCSTPCLVTGDNCGQARFGYEGLAQETQAEAARTAIRCTNFVKNVRELIGERYAVRDLYTCPPNINGNCHVSAVIDTPEASYVVDNGALKIPGDVMPLQEFALWYAPNWYSFNKEDRP